jgi:hypothetical protein
VCILGGFAVLPVQSQEKHRVRLKADYIKLMNEHSLLELKATARINKQTVDISGVELLVVHEIEGEEIELGKLTTDQKGEGIFGLTLNALKADSLHTYTLSISFKGVDTLKRASKTVQFRDAILEAQLVTRDSVQHLQAILKDAIKDSVLEGQNIKVQVERLFAPLVLSKEINLTDDNGMILVPIPAGIPGVDGMLTLETVLEDSDDYGTIKATMKSPLGVPIVEESTFDERTLWAPRNRTPIFILLFTGLLVVGCWGVIIYLIRMLFKIAKH